MNTAQIFDLNALRELTDGNAEIESELAQLFFKTADSCLQRLQPLVSSDSGSQWPRVLHEFKGACANLHADVLAQLCQRAEHLDEKPELRSAALNDIRKAYTELKPLLEALVR
ncbi:MAG: hypothetical protein EBR02_03755 [Alphaproteobacteria bacterium]|nr:hypothetical protein [Alphaproteobacteria bacterium]